jgi:ABC-type transporter Mla subunit MlaD
MALKNFMSLFFVQEETGTKTENKTDNQANKNISPPIHQQNVPPPIPIDASIDQRIFDSLQQALNSSNMEGYDYMEFKNAIQSLAGIIPDEAMRFKSAFATVAPMGVTAQKLLESAKYYKNVLLQEQDKFNQALSNQIDTSVGAKQKQSDDLKVMIQKKSEEIQRLTQEMEAHQQEIGQLEGQIGEVVIKLEATKNNFDYTLNTIISQMDMDLVSIEKHLLG